MRRAKEPEIRKGEILDAAKRLFIEKGYGKTTVTDILDVHGLSKGVFYYYFQSKKEVMEAIIQNIIDIEVANAEKIVDSDLTPPQKLFAILSGNGLSEEDDEEKRSLLSQFHLAENAEMHQKCLILTVTHLAPVMARIFEQIGSESHSPTNYPTEMAALLLASGEFFFDKGFLPLSDEERKRYAMAFVEMVEKVSCVPSGYFGEVKNTLS